MLKTNDYVNGGNGHLGGTTGPLDIALHLMADNEMKQMVNIESKQLLINILTQC